MMIEIKWPSGHMSVDTNSFFQQPKIVQRFRSILKLSQACDLLYGTHTMALWRGAIAAEKGLLQELARQSSDLYQRRCDTLRREYEDPSLPFHEQMEQQAELQKKLRSEKKYFDREMAALSKRFGRMEKLWKLVQQ